MPQRTATSHRERRRAGALAAHALLIVALAGGIVLRLALPSPSQRTPDELAYTVYAAAIHRDGLAARRTLVANYTADSLLAEIPPPTRVGMSWLGSMVMSLTGSSMVTSLVSLSMLCSILQLGVLAVIAVGALDAWTAALAVAFLAASPLDLAIARRAWADDVLGLVASVMLWVFLRAAMKPGGRAWPAAFFALAAFAPLVKETGLVLVALGSAGLALVEWRAARDWRRPLLMLVGGVATIAATAALLSLVCGGTASWIAALEHAAGAVANNDYVRRYQTGSALYYAQGLAILQPVPWLLGTAGALLVAARAPLMRGPWTRPGALAALAAAAWFALLFAGLACTYEQKNLRFLSLVYAPVALLAAALVRSALAGLGGRLPRRAGRMVTVVAAIVLAVSLYADLRRFADLFLRRDLPDLATPWFTGAGAAPPR